MSARFKTSPRVEDEMTCRRHKAQQELFLVVNEPVRVMTCLRHLEERSCDAVNTETPLLLSNSQWKPCQEKWVEIMKGAISHLLARPFSFSAINKMWKSEIYILKKKVPSSGDHFIFHLLNCSPSLTRLLHSTVKHGGGMSPVSPSHENWIEVKENLAADAGRWRGQQSRAPVGAIVPEWCLARGNICRFSIQPPGSLEGHLQVDKKTDFHAAQTCPKTGKSDFGSLINPRKRIWGTKRKTEVEPIWSY